MFRLLYYKRIELEEKFGSELSVHMEVQDHETQAFKGLFKCGLMYMDGSVTTNVEQATVSTAHKPRLLHVKGYKNISVQQVESSPSAMNCSGIFILDLGSEIYQWNGKECNRMEKQRAMGTTRSIRDQEQKGKARVFIVDQDNATSADLEKEFWESFGHAKPSSMKEATDDGCHWENTRVKSIKLFHIKHSDGSTHEVTERPLKKDALDTNGAYILNTGPAGVYVWVGRRVGSEYKKKAMILAQKFVKDKHDVSLRASPVIPPCSDLGY